MLIDNFVIERVFGERLQTKCCNSFANACKKVPIIDK